MTDISKGNTVSVPPFLLGRQLSVPNFEKGGGGIRKKMSAWRGLNESLP